MEAPGAALQAEAEDSHSSTKITRTWPRAVRRRGKKPYGKPQVRSPVQTAATLCDAACPSRQRPDTPHAAQDEQEPVPELAAAAPSVRPSIAPALEALDQSVLSTLSRSLLRLCEELMEYDEPSV